MNKKFYPVIIREVTQTGLLVSAESEDEAIQIAGEQYEKGYGTCYMFETTEKQFAIDPNWKGDTNEALA